MSRIKFQFEVTRSLSLLLLMSLMASIAEAEKKIKTDVMTYRGGIRNSNGEHQLEPKYLALFLENLREKTGFTGLRFDEHDYLVVDDPEKFVGGSATARKLLLAGMEAKLLFNLENHNRSAQVNFARLERSTTFRNMTTKLEVEVRPLIIDFSDYDHLSGDRDVRHAFDLGINFLHELVHGVYQLRDAVEDRNELGECEDFVNTIRRDLGLPERQKYLARIYKSGMPSGSFLQRAELEFTRTKEKNGRLKTETAILSWDIGKVGLVTVDEQLLIANKAKGIKATAGLH
jgi:hypothetical protein